MSKSRGTFISFDGPEGSGKSSQSRLLVRSLVRAGLPVLAVRDPGSTPLGLATRRILLHSKHNLSAKAETLLFWAGRVELVQSQILPALKQGQIVVCDRFHDATVAYQGYGGVLDPGWVDRVGRELVGGTMPQLTLLMDLPVKAGFERLRRSHDRMERKALAYHERVRQGYLHQARKEPKRICVLDATLSKKEIHRQVLAAVAQRLPKTRAAKLKRQLEA